jgi:hypothetical protein
MRRVLMILLVLLPFVAVPQAYGGVNVNITSATIDSGTLTLKGINFDANGSNLIVIINGAILSGCNVTNSEVSCDISGQSLDPGTMYTVSIAAGNAPGLNDEMDIYNPEDLSGSCPTGGFTACYSGPGGTLGIGECKSGTTACGNNGDWGPCEGDVTPTTEICGDEFDSDCDGQVNNGCTGPCDDGNGCTENDQWVDGVCEGIPTDCDDGLACTIDSCVFSGGGACSSEIDPSSCLIGNNCYASGSSNPNGACQYCDPNMSQVNWSNRPYGTACGAGYVCDGSGACLLASGESCALNTQCASGICDSGTCQ